jgi:hypothetical protein
VLTSIPSLNGIGELMHTLTNIIYLILGFVLCLFGIWTAINPRKYQGYLLDRIAGRDDFWANLSRDFINVNWPFVKYRVISVGTFLIGVLLIWVSIVRLVHPH